MATNNKIRKHTLIPNYEVNIPNQYYLNREFFDVTLTDPTRCVKNSWFRMKIIQMHEM